MKPTQYRRNFPYHLIKVRDADVYLHRTHADYLRSCPATNDAQLHNKLYVSWLQSLRSANNLLLTACQQLETEIANELSDVWFSPDKA